MTSAPRAAAPRAKASDRPGEEGRMSCPITIASAAVTSAKAAPNSSASASSHWVGDDAAHVVRLHDLRQIGHSQPSWRVSTELPTYPGRSACGPCIPASAGRGAAAGPGPAVRGGRRRRPPRDRVRAQEGQLALRSPASAAPADGRGGRLPWGRLSRSPGCGRRRAGGAFLGAGRLAYGVRQGFEVVAAGAGAGRSRGRGGRPPSRGARSAARSARRTGRSSAVRRRWRAGRARRSNPHRRTSASRRRGGRTRCANSDVQGSRRWTVPHS